MATEIKIDMRDLRLDRAAALYPERAVLYLPPGTNVLAMNDSFFDFTMRLLVEYPFGWCVQRVSGDCGDMVGADYDYNMEVE